MQNDISYQKALFFFKKKDYDRSLFYLNKSIKNTPSNIEAYYYTGRIYFIKKNYGFAKEYFALCYSKENDNLHYNLYLGKTHLALKEFNESLKFLDKYAKENRDGYFYLALAYYNLNEFHTSCKLFSICENLFSNKKLFSLAYSAALFNYGNQLYINEKTAEAKSLFLQSVRINNEAYPSFFQLGAIYLFEKDYESSRNIFEKLHNRFPGNDAIKISLAHIYHNLNDLTKFEKIIREMNNNTDISNLGNLKFKKILGYTLFRKNKYKEAIPLFIQLFKAKEYDTNLLHCLATCRYYTGEIEKTINTYETILKITQTDTRINNNYLLILIENGYYKKATLLSEYLIKNYLCNDKTKLFYYYASIYADIKFNFNFYYTKLNTSYKNNFMFLEATAVYFQKIANYDKAIFYFHKLHSQIPNDKGVILKLVDIFILKKSNDKIIEYLDKAYKLDTSDDKIALYYSDYLIKTGLYDNAISILKNIKGEVWKSSYLLSDIYFKLNDKHNHLIYLKKAFDINPLYLPIQYKSIVYFYKNKNFIQSLRICKLMEYTNKDFKRVFIYEALLYFKKNRTDLAIHRLEKYLSIEKEKENPYLKFALSNCLFASGRTDDAKKISLHLIKNNGIKAPYLVMLCLCYRRNFDQSKLEKAESILRKRFSDSPCFIEYSTKYLEKSNIIIRKDIGIRI